ncbi:response regulator transcription factor [Shewanella sp. OMA3-2]|uniref:response regulator transcription factor n=1 Tax=Shewanella sp. OMA3-2 TaxID=2908650 RepID=UPI001F36F5E6|nr:response regulator transcription factor [Shewanella sp. OMA3-2]UJF20794.1 response regulator transcription factor [Shewanella sp. OMA3-2]
MIDQQLEMSFDLTAQLTEIGYQVIVVNNAFQARVNLETQLFEAVLVDLSVPKMESFWSFVTGKCSTPIITLASKNDEFEKINALELGADDYLSKPFNLRELQLRLNVIKRRSNLASNADEPITIRFDDPSYSLNCNGHKITLTNTEYRLFKYLYERQGRW